MPKYLDIDGLRTLWAQITNKISHESNATAEALEGKADLVEGKIPASQLPSYVDDVLEYANKASFPATGESGKIYLDLATNLTYRWSGTAYTEISPSLALGTTSSTAYRGDYGAAAYKHAVTNKGIAKSSGLYKITTNAEGHVTAATAVVKADITGLGIPAQDTTYENATTTTNGLMSSSDKTKLNSINLSALVKSVNGITPDSNGNVTIEVGGGTGGTVSGDYLPLTGGTLSGSLRTTKTSQAFVMGTSAKPTLVTLSMSTGDLGTRTYFTHYDENSSYYENFVLPGTKDLTKEGNYWILTTKSAVTVAQGGTGKTTLTSGYALIGNGTDAVSLRAITDNTETGGLGWTKTLGTNLVTLNTLAYFDGSYNGTTSNITKLGTISKGIWNSTAIGVEYGGTGATTPEAARTALGITDNKVAQTLTDNTTSKIFYLLSGESSTTTTTGSIFNKDLKANIKNGTADTEGFVELYLGNATAKGSAGNKTGKVALYSNGTRYHLIIPSNNAITTNITHTLPTVSGTFLNTGNYSSYALPLSGGTVTGSLTVGDLAIKRSNNYPTVRFYNSDGDEAGSIQFNASTHKGYIVQKATDTTYQEIYNLPVVSTGLTANKNYDILTSKGGTITGNLTISNSNNYSYLYLANQNGENIGGLYASDSENRLYLINHAPNSTTGKYEGYGLPAVTTDNLTEHKWYKILTSKEAVTIPQGGTGATTVRDAINNLGLREAPYLGSGDYDDITDLNDLVLSGLFQVAGNFTNAPLTNPCFVLNVKGTNNRTTQFGWRSNVTTATKNIYMRRQGDTAGTWDDWEIVAGPGLNTDTKVTQTLTEDAAKNTNWYLLASSSQSTGTRGAVFTKDLRVQSYSGTTSATGEVEMIIGNSTASGTAGNKEGFITLYSQGSSYHMIKTTSVSSGITHTLPAVSGTILNSGNYQNYAKLSNLGDVVVATSTPSSVTNGKWYLIKQG